MFSNPFIGVINQLLPEPHASLLNGILFGVKTQMPYYLYQGLIDTGLLHMVALSGMNISILIDLVAKLTLFLGRRISIVVTIVIIGAFVAMVGASPSLIRAAIMGSMTLLSVYLGRKEWGILSLFLTSGIMLLFRGEWLFEISFQLSFLATLGILLGNDLVKKRHTFRFKEQVIYGLRENLVMTLSAQLFTLPVILLYFNRVSVIAPIANLLTGWVIQFVMIFGGLAALVGAIWLPLGLIPSYIAYIPLTYFLTVVKILSQVPGASITF